MSIITFYSYKGGVGRSMALANTAVLLAKRGKRVLVVDWDLEAPGIERYFSYFQVDSRGPGLLNFFIQSNLGLLVDYSQYLWTVRGEGLQFSLLASGKEFDNRYSANLESFHWQEFFQQGGGDLIERLRMQWRNEYDFVLIDSRTGLSDTGGICTIQLPDIVVAMFTPNQQSLYGARDVIRLAQAARQSLAYDRMQLSVIPLPARFGKNTELQESDEWLNRSAEAMGEFYREWVPDWIKPRQILERLCVPQIDFFGFGEKLAILEQGTSDPAGMGFVYDRLATLLTEDLRKVEEILHIDKAEMDAATASAPTGSAGYEYDVYVSYAHTSMTEEWLRPFIQLLGDYLSELKGEPARIFFDYREISVGADWPAVLRHSLIRSKVLLAVLTPTYFRSDSCVAEWETFSEREKLAGGHQALSIFPVLLVGDARLPAEAMERQLFDLTSLFRRGIRPLLQKRPTLEVLEHVSKLANSLNQMLENVVVFNDNAPVVSPSAAHRSTMTSEGSDLWPLLSQADQASTQGAIEKIRKALAEGKWLWRSVESLSGKVALTSEETLRLLRADPEVELGRSESGRTIARLRSRVT